MKRRMYLGVMGTVGVSCALGAVACASPKVHVSTPLDSALGESVLSVQATGEKGLLGPLSPNRRYAERMQVQLKNRLIRSGFVLKEKTADLHLHVILELVTTGGSNNEAECRIRVKGYREWPGDLLDMQEKQQSTSVPQVLELTINVVKKRLPQGYNRELLAEEAVQDAVELLVDYLVQSR